MLFKPIQRNDHHHLHQKLVRSYQLKTDVFDAEQRDITQETATTIPLLTIIMREHGTPTLAILEPLAILEKSDPLPLPTQTYQPFNQSIITLFNK